MKRKNCSRVTVLLAMVVIFFVTGCSLLKGTVTQSSSQPQNEMKQAAVAPPKQETVKQASAKAKVTLVTEGAQTVAMSGNELRDIYFDFDKDVLRPDDRTILGVHAGWLQKNAAYKVKIEGNCDERGTEEYNLALGQKRADNARRYLMDIGIDGKRISTISYGKERPLDPAHNEEAWAKNRRDHFVLNQ